MERKLQGYMMSGPFTTAEQDCREAKERPEKKKTDMMVKAISVS